MEDEPQSPSEREIRASMYEAVRAILADSDKDQGRQTARAVIDRFAAEHAEAGVMRLLEVMFAENITLYARIAAHQQPSADSTAQDRGANGDARPAPDGDEP
ncbi:hypothetical protein GCM10010472_03140 [Pseudonocardia halophobica]|uniref:Uncharacterized protein n=1 Tax=Pseudonocardia halophobica TaxID=29401 RepID=A0A9W6L1S1_9PSEU|nr:hypothetical protein [Pseudonocardia halophobica]GLL10654.1 hypothetical protein GCM10017577_17940 [Pseudonocardia halophobica]